MERLPNIVLSNQELDLIIDNNQFNYGGEAIVCRNNNPHTLYKIFVQPGTDIPSGMSDNKLRKIEWLFQNPLEGTVKPMSTISNQGKLIGYEMTYDRDYETLIDATLTPEEKIHFLYTTADILRRFATRDITFGDVKDDNILINKKTGQARFCDVDNMRIKDLPIDLMNYVLSEYYDVTQVVDQKVDAFMHNLLFLEQLKYHNVAHRDILYRVKSESIKGEFPEDVERVIQSMFNPERFTGEYAIQYIKRK